MGSIFFINIPKIGFTGHLPRLCKISQSHNKTQIALLKRLAFRESKPKPPPFPYWKKKFTVFHGFIDPTYARLDESTKLIVVDGPPAVGKAKLCEQLAEQFGFLYMPAPTHDEHYVNRHGYDLRELDPKLPFRCQSFDLKKYLANPHDIRTIDFQLLYFLMRFEQYISALLHMLSSGQGVILNRCAYSEIAFVEAMRKAGYLSEPIVAAYMAHYNILCRYLYRPHVVIYLDVPPELVKEKIQRDGNPDEVNSKVYTTQYLSDLETAYKEKYFQKFANHSYLLTYDWSDGGHFLDIVQDIEDLDLDTYTETKLADWVFDSISEMQSAITLFQKPAKMIQDMNDIAVSFPPEMWLSPEDALKMEEVYESVPSEKYAYQYNPSVGDKVLFKTAAIPPYFYYMLRRSPRDFINLNKMS